MAGWAESLGLPAPVLVRWRASGILHDALKDAANDELRALVGEEWPAPVAHGPACAARLRRDGVADGELLNAIAYHPVGHPDLAELGEYLILADYLDPERDDCDEERARLRAMLPEGRAEALSRVLARRIERLLRAERRLLACTVDMWNRVVAP
jgi:HD superfamily phosphohydrolase YqeK